MNNDIKEIIAKSLEQAKKNRLEIEIVNRFYIGLFKRYIVIHLDLSGELLFLNPPTACYVIVCYKRGVEGLLASFLVRMINYISND